MVTGNRKSSRGAALTIGAMAFALAAHGQPAPALGGAPSAKIGAPPAAASVKAGAGGGPGESAATPAPTVVGDRPQAPSTITNPQWTEQPTAEELRKAYPLKALAQGVDGRATLTCRIGEDGGLTACEAREMPEGLGFAEAAMALADRYKMPPVTPGGIPLAGARVSVPIRFSLAPPPPPAP